MFENGDLVKFLKFEKQGLIIGIWKELNGGVSYRVRLLNGHGEFFETWAAAEEMEKA